MIRLLRSPIRHVLPRNKVLLRYMSPTGATITLPVQAAQEATRLSVLVGRADKKRWWRHFHHAARGGRVARLQMAGLVDLHCDSRLPLNLRGKPLLLRWLATVTAGEFAGFAVPAVTGALTARAPVAAAVVAILAASAVEGTMLFLAQATVLRHALLQIAPLGGGYRRRRRTGVRDRDAALRARRPVGRSAWNRSG